MKILSRIKKTFSYFCTWMIPSHTFGYVILHDYMGYGIVDGYILSGIISAMVMYPIINFVMHIGEKRKEATENGK